MQTQERVAELYEEHKKIVEGIAVNFATKYHKDIEESLSQANLIFMQVFSKHDDTKGDFKIRLLHLLPRRLAGTLRRADGVVPYCTRRLSPDKPPPFFFLSCDFEEGLVHIAEKEEKETTAFDYDSVNSRVSPDASMILSEIENISGNVALEVGDTVNGKRALYKFRKFVRSKLGWSRERIVAAFDELEACRA